MKTLIELAAELGRETSSVRLRALKHGVPMAKAISPTSSRMVLVLDAAAEKQLRALYPKKLTVIAPAVATEGARA